jgi:hypothetical protein
VIVGCLTLVMRIRFSASDLLCSAPMSPFSPGAAPGQSAIDSDGAGIVVAGSAPASDANESITISA